MCDTARVMITKRIIAMTSVVVLMKHVISCVQILECGGNLFDAVSLAVKAALHNTRVPKVKGACMDGGTVDLQLPDDPYDCCRLDMSAAPCLVTLCKVGARLHKNRFIAIIT
jgi:exosome complex component RRP42